MTGEQRHIVVRGPHRSRFGGAWLAGPCTCGAEVTDAATEEEAAARMAPCREAQAARAEPERHGAGPTVPAAGDRP